MKIPALTENHLFGKTYSRGKHAATASVVVYALRDTQARRLQKAHPRHLVQNRVGLTVSKKQGGAVVRNRIKRRLRAAYRELAATETLRTGKLVVIVARSAAKDVAFSHLVRDMRRAFVSVGLIESEEISQTEKK